MATAAAAQVTTLKSAFDAKVMLNNLLNQKTEEETLSLFSKLSFAERESVCQIPTDSRLYIDIQDVLLLKLLAIHADPQNKLSTKLQLFTSLKREDGLNFYCDAIIMLADIVFELKNPNMKEIVAAARNINFADKVQTLISTV